MTNQPITRTGLSGGQILFGLFLCLFFFFPGIIYFICAARTTRTIEPPCLVTPLPGMFALPVDVNNPRGRQANPYKRTI